MSQWAEDGIRKRPTYHTWSTTYQGGYDRQQKAQGGVDTNKDLVGCATFPSRKKTEKRHCADDSDGEAKYRAHRRHCPNYKKKNTKSCRKTHIMKWLIVVWIFQCDIYLRTSRQHSRLGLPCDWFCWRGCARRRRVATIGWGRMPLLQPELCTSILGNAPKFKKFILEINSDANVISDYLFGNERFVHSAGKILRLRFQSTKETSITKHHCGIQPWSLDFSWYQ